MCVHEDMKKIPARPLLIDYGLAGMDYGLFSPPFLPLMEEKEQKKIKASGTPAKLAGYQARFPAPEGAVRDASQVCRGHQGTPAKLAGYMIEMIVYPAFIFHFSFSTSSTSPLAR